MTRRIRLIISFLVFLLCAAPCFGEPEREAGTVSISVRNAPVKVFLRRLEAASGISMVYSDSDLDSRRITVSAKDRTVLEILAEALPDFTAEEVLGKIILVRKAPGPVSGSSKVSGIVVSDDGEGIPGAAVVVFGRSSRGVLADDSGRFSLTLSPEDRLLEVSCLGYTTRTVRPSDGFLSVVLDSEVPELAESYVIGYGESDGRSMTTSISRVLTRNSPVSIPGDFREALIGKMAGVHVTTLGGQPEGNISIRVRGIQSATSGNDPLYIIDGIPEDSRSFANLDMSEIESIEVMKDAAAAAVYGSRGSCGVVMVTTRRGKKDSAASIHVESTSGVSTVSKKLEMLDAKEFAMLFKEARDGAYLSSVRTGTISDPYAGRPRTYQRVLPIVEKYLEDGESGLVDTDWQDQIFRRAFFTRHSLSVSGRGSNVNYYAGVNYLKRDGTIKGSGYRKAGARVSLDGKARRWSYGITLSPNWSVTDNVDSDSQYQSYGVVASALMAPPIFPVYNPDGSYNWDMNGLLRYSSWDTQATEVLNPVALALEIRDRRETVSMTGSGYAGYILFPGAELKAVVGAGFNSYIRDYYKPSTIAERTRFVEGGYSPERPVAVNTSEGRSHWNASLEFSYKGRFGPHSFAAEAVVEAEKQVWRKATIRALGTPGDDKINTTKGLLPDISSTLDDRYATTFGSVFARGRYSFRDRYLASVSVRGDMSSRFAPGSRLGFFPAVSLGWIMSEEPFLAGVDALSLLKLRFSAGQTGNAQIGNWEYLSVYSTSPVYMGDGAGVVHQVYPKQIANKSLGWEKNTQFNCGLDLSAWGGRLSLTADAYYSRTTDMLFEIPVPSSSGFGTANTNIGSMENKGVELELSSAGKTDGGFTYSVSVNWTLNRNKVLSLGEKDAPIIKSSDYSGGYYITQVGQPVGCYYLLVQDGVFHNQGELDSYPHFASSQVGDFRFIDVDGDGVLEKDDDRAIVGNHMPDFYYGLGLLFGWKGIELSADFHGTYGNEILNLERRYLLNMEGSSNMMKESLERFPYGELNRANRKSTGNTGSATSSFHIEDGSFFRLRKLSLGYTFPSRLTRKVRIDTVKLYLQASNLFTLTNYSGYNPEVNRNIGDAMRPGEDYCSYPLSRTFSVGVVLNL